LAISHLPSAQQDILPFLSFDIMGQDLPSAPEQQVPSLQHAASFVQQAACLPQQAILPATLSWLQQAQLFAWSSAAGGVAGVALWAIKPKAMIKVLRITSSFDFIMSSEFGWRGLIRPP
jgi:hypothetical protein